MLISLQFSGADQEFLGRVFKSCEGGSFSEFKYRIRSN